MRTRFEDGADLLFVPLGAIAEACAEDHDIACRWDERTPAQAWAQAPAGLTPVTLLIPYRGADVPEFAVVDVEIGEDDMRRGLSLAGQAWNVQIGRAVQANH